MHRDGDPAGVPPLVQAIDGAPGREISGQRPPHAPVVDDIPDRIHHHPAAVLFRAPARRGLAGRNRQQRRDQRPLGISGIGGVEARAAATPTGACAGPRGRADSHQDSWCGWLVSHPRHYQEPRPHSSQPSSRYPKITTRRRQPRHPPRVQKQALRVSALGQAVRPRRDYVFAGTPKVPVGWSSGAREDLAPAGQVTAARIVCDRRLTGHMASDHYGVLAEICWPGRPGSRMGR